jgi:predicted nucleic acid-binding protein
MWLTALQRAEFTNAVAQHVFRRVITEFEAQAVYSQFEGDRASGFWSEVELPKNTFELCIDLARRYTPQLGIRTLDILHVASALELKASQFWTFDDRQAKLAKAVGLKVS